MKQFLAVYLGSLSSPKHSDWSALSEQARTERIRAGLQAWGNWMDAHKDAVVVAGGPLGKTKRVSDDGIADVRNELSGFVIVKAESHLAAAKLFERHPHFTIFPGDSVEIMECLPIPGM